MAKFYYPIKGRLPAGPNREAEWVWPPVFSGMVETDNRKLAKTQIDELYGRQFPQRVLRTDMNDHAYLLHIQELREHDTHGPFFRQIWPHRAICPIDNWFEWVDEGDPKKQPYLIRHRDGSPILCASIGQLPDADEGAREHDGFVIITADSVGGMVVIHDRRPVVLVPELAREWLDSATPKERAEQMALHQAEAADAFERFKVSTVVGNVRSHGPELIEPTTKPTGGDAVNNG
ncbi:MAG: SOS response-associated peptidase family protein [Pseudomonadales bacterium]